MVFIRLALVACVLSSWTSAFAQSNVEEKANRIVDLFAEEVTLVSEEPDLEIPKSQKAKLANILLEALLRQSRVSLLEAIELPEDDDVAARKTVQELMRKILQEELENLDAPELVAHRETYLKTIAEKKGRELSPAEVDIYKSIYAHILASAATHMDESMYRVIQLVPASVLSPLQPLGVLPKSPDDENNKIYNGWFTPKTSTDNTTPPSAELSPNTTETVTEVQSPSRSSPRIIGFVDLSTRNPAPRGREPRGPKIINTPDELLAELHAREANLKSLNEGNTARKHKAERYKWGKHLFSLIRKGIEEGIYEFPFTINPYYKTSYFILFSRAIQHYQETDPFLKAQLESWIDLVRLNGGQNLSPQAQEELLRRMKKLQAHLLSNLIFGSSDDRDSVLEASIASSIPEALQENIRTYLTDDASFDYWNLPVNRSSSSFDGIGLLNSPPSNLLKEAAGRLKSKLGKFSLVRRHARKMINMNDFKPHMELSKNKIDKLVDDLVLNNPASIEEWSAQLHSRNIFIKKESMRLIYTKTILYLNSEPSPEIKCAAALAITAASATSSP